MANDDSFTYYIVRFTFFDRESKMLRPTKKDGAIVVFRKFGSEATDYRIPKIVEEGNTLEVRINVPQPTDAKEVADKLLFREGNYRTPDFGVNPVKTICEDE